MLDLEHGGAAGLLGFENAEGDQGLEEIVQAIDISIVSALALRRCLVHWFVTVR